MARRITDLAALAARRAQVVGLACRSRRSGPKRNGSCTVIAAAYLRKFFAIISGLFVNTFVDSSSLPSPRGRAGGRGRPKDVRNRGASAASPGKERHPLETPQSGSGVSRGWLSKASTADASRLRDD